MTTFSAEPEIFFSVSTFFPEPENSGPSVYCIRSVFSVLRRFRSHYFAPKFSVQNRFKILIKWFEIVQILPQWTVFFRKARMSWSTNGSIQQFITKISSKFFSYSWLLSLRSLGGAAWLFFILPPYTVAPRFKPMSSSRVAPDWDLWRTLYRLSYSTAAIIATWLK